ncbi:MAG: PQQ-binding-like beta-propeller repeat protein, partial [bacterium]
MWEAKVESPVRSSPVVGGGVVVFGAMDGRVIALDKDTGEKVWEFGGSEEAIVSSPAMEGG